MRKSERTRERIAACALELFEHQGFEATTVAQIAEAAEVTQMTVFRYFPSKEWLVLDDPYDPLIAELISTQPHDLSPLARAAGGVLAAWKEMPEPEGDAVRRRIRVAATSPTVRAGQWRNNAETERLITEQLTADGAERVEAAVAASAVLAALTTALYIWAEDETMTLTDAISIALTTLVSHD